MNNVLKPCPFCGGVIECIDLKWRQTWKTDYTRQTKSQKL